MGTEPGFMSKFILLKPSQGGIGRVGRGAGVGDVGSWGLGAHRLAETTCGHFKPRADWVQLGISHPLGSPASKSSFCVAAESWERLQATLSRGGGPSPWTPSLLPSLSGSSLFFLQDLQQLTTHPAHLPHLQ